MEPYDKSADFHWDTKLYQSFIRFSFLEVVWSEPRTRNMDNHWEQYIWLFYCIFFERKAVLSQCYQDIVFYSQCNQYSAYFVYMGVYLFAGNARYWSCNRLGMACQCKLVWDEKNGDGNNRDRFHMAKYRISHVDLYGRTPNDFSRYC